MTLAKKIEGLDIFKVTQDTFNILNKKEYLDKFNELLTKGFFRRCTFYDNKWIYVIAEEEKSAIFLDKVDLEKVKLSLGFSLSLDQIDMAMKAFILKSLSVRVDIKSTTKAFKLLTRGITGLKELVYDNETEVKIFESNKNTEFGILLDFIKYIKLNKDKASQIEELFSGVTPIDYGSRLLPSFKDTLKFGEIITEILNDSGALTVYQKFIPTFLWFRISGIIPLRPIELVRTKFDCISNEKGVYSIKVYRNALKGCKRFNYEEIMTIEDITYKEDTLAISEELYLFILKIQEISKNFEVGSEKLFSKSLKSPVRYRNLNKDLFTTQDLTKNIKDFYHEVVNAKYGYSIISRYEENLGGKSMQYMTANDLRHLAIINLLRLGEDIRVVQKLAGHQSIRTTERYANHIEEYVDCYIITLADKFARNNKKNKHIKINASVENTDNRAMNRLNEAIDIVEGKEVFEPVEIDFGYCSYPNQDDFSVCNRVKIVCFHCPYFISTDMDALLESLQEDSKEINSQIQIIKNLLKNKHVFEWDTTLAVTARKLGKAMINQATALSKLESFDVEK